MASFVEVQTPYGRRTINVERIESFERERDYDDCTRVYYPGDDGNFIVVSLKYTIFKDLLEAAGHTIKSIHDLIESLEKLGYSKDEAKAKLLGE